MGCDPRECHASTRLTLSINVRLLYTRFCATAINTVTSQVRSMSVGLHTHSHAENITVVFNLILISCWVVAASLMAEKTNVGVAVFVADNTCVVTGRMERLSSFLHARLSASAVISFSSHVLRCCFRAILHFVR